MAKWRWIGYSVVIALPTLLPLCGCGGSEPVEAPPDAVDDTSPPNVELDMPAAEEATTGDTAAPAEDAAE